MEEKGYIQCSEFLNPGGRLGRFCTSEGPCIYDKVNRDSTYQIDIGDLGKSCRVEGEVPKLYHRSLSELEKVALE